MSFFRTPLRRLCLLRAVALLILALVCLCFPLLADVDAFGRNFLIALTALCVALALFNFWRARRAAPGAFVTVDPQQASVPEQLRCYRRLLWMSSLAFPVLIAWTAYDLQRLETGAVASVRLWAPVVWLYRHGGFWPTLVSLAVLGLVCVATFAFKIRRLPSATSAGRFHGPGKMDA